ncbi:helix-turn-helix domain-containing protein [Pseudomonas abieticivorans]|uniref:helix-turn-helix domain-containing protein n=1 Tax=Pseudomonas abieticivorans TaxID=2931382 RepID=UPI0020C022D5|nr:helix-turn-helix domain-containing protein [Pseudomonas sp. PIA16]
MSKPSINAIPVFKLYGEGQDWPTPDLLHCETIPKRSRLHHWEIKPHRHADLCQLLYVHQGQAEIEVEGQRRVISDSAIQVVPALFVHGFRFAENIDGYVITLAAPLVNELQHLLGGPSQVFAAPACYPAGADRDYLNGIVSALQREYANDSAGRDLVLHSLINLIVVWVSRQMTRRTAAGQTAERGRDYLNRFNGLVEAHFRKHWSVEQLAHEVGISVAHLNNVCRELAGQSALQVIHQRQLLEAKRSLTYTTMTINQVSDSLGFADPAYFSRFFRRLAGVTPKAFRQTTGINAVR